MMYDLRKGLFSFFSLRNSLFFSFDILVCTLIIIIGFYTVRKSSEPIILKYHLEIDIDHLLGPKVKFWDTNTVVLTVQDGSNFLLINSNFWRVERFLCLYNFY